MAPHRMGRCKCQELAVLAKWEDNWLQVECRAQLHPPQSPLTDCRERAAFLYQDGGIGGHCGESFVIFIPGPPLGTEAYLTGLHVQYRVWHRHIFLSWRRSRPAVPGSIVLGVQSCSRCQCKPTRTIQLYCKQTGVCFRKCNGNNNDYDYDNNHVKLP